MSSWRTFADELLKRERGETKGTIGTIMDPKGHSVPIVPFVLNALSNPKAMLREWNKRLSALNDHPAPEGYMRFRWQQICDNARWLNENYAIKAVQMGWSTADLFGLCPGKPGWGGVADRLNGSRSLAIDADRAIWQQFGVRMSFNRGSYPDLLPLWEA